MTGTTIKDQIPRGGCTSCGGPVRTRKRWWGWVCTDCARVFERRSEANRIAAAEGYAIKDHDRDWTFFELADDLKVEDGTLRTCFEWVAGRFEGFVSTLH